MLAMEYNNILLAVMNFQLATFMVSSTLSTTIILSIAMFLCFYVSEVNVSK